MVTEFDNEMVPEAQAILDEFGMDVILTYETGTYDAATGSVSTPAPTTETVKMSPPVPIEMKYVDGDVIKHGDVEAYLAAQDLVNTPRNGMKVTIKGEVFQAVEASPLYSGELIAAWKLRLRR